MYFRSPLFMAFAILVALCAISTVSAVNAHSSQPEDLRALDGEWIYVEDRTEGRALEELGPPMSSTFLLGVEDDGTAVILNNHGSGHRNVRVALDGSVTEFGEESRRAHYQGGWKDGAFEYVVTFTRGADKTPDGFIRRNFRMTDDGLLVRVTHELAGSSGESVALYRHAEDIEMPTGVEATISDMTWLAGQWVGQRSSGSSIEERWSPALGGAMLAVSRTVNKNGKMVAFEYLRILERDGGLVYIAQPGGGAATEFVLTELGATEQGGTRAVFDNPRHDYPKRIVYELSAEGDLSATIGFMKGGTPRRFEWKREDS